MVIPVAIQLQQRGGFSWGASMPRTARAEELPEERDRRVAGVVRQALNEPEQGQRIPQAPEQASPPAEEKPEKADASILSSQVKLLKLLDGDWSPRDLGQTYQRVLAFLAAGRFDEAIRLLEKLSLDATGWRLLGLAQSLKGAVLEANRAFERSVESSGTEEGLRLEAQFEQQLAREAGRHPGGAFGQAERIKAQCRGYEQLSSSPLQIFAGIDFGQKAESWLDGLWRRLTAKVKGHYTAILSRFEKGNCSTNAQGKTYWYRRPSALWHGLRRLVARAEGTGHIPAAIQADLVRVSFGPGTDLRSGWHEVESRFYPESGYAGALYIHPSSGSHVVVHQMPTDLRLLERMGEELEPHLADARDFISAIQPDLRRSSISHSGYRLGGMVAQAMAAEGGDCAVVFDSPGVGKAISGVEVYMSTPDGINTRYEQHAWVEYLPSATLEGSGVLMTQDAEAMEGFVAALRTGKAGSWSSVKDRGSALDRLRELGRKMGGL